MPYDIDYTRCNHCGKCIQACPKHCFYPHFAVLVAYYRWPYCNDCGACVEVCKRDALFYIDHDTAKMLYPSLYRKKLTKEQAKQLMTKIMKNLFNELSEEEKREFLTTIRTYDDVDTMIEASPVFKKVYSEMIKRFEKAIQL